MPVTEPSDQTPAREGANAPAARLAIFETVGAQRTPLGIVAAVRADDGNWSLQCSAMGDSLNKIRAVLEAYAAARSTLPAADRVPEPPDFGQLVGCLNDRSASHSGRKCA